MINQYHGGGTDKKKKTEKRPCFGNKFFQVKNYEKRAWLS